VNVALVGAGVIAARYAVCIRAQPRLTLLGATDPLPGRAAALGAADYPSLDALLADDAVELVVVLTPPSLHAALLRGGSGLSTYAALSTVEIERRKSAVHEAK